MGRYEDFKMKKRKIGKNQRKILLFLLGGIALGLSASPRKYFQVISALRDEWKDIDRRHLKKAILSLYDSRLVSEQENADGTVTLVLSKDGKREALRFNLEKIKIRRTQWDGKWRMVLSDIPEKMKSSREAWRFHLKKIGLKELQKSVYVCPFECHRELDFIIEYFNLRKYVRVAIVDSIDNGLDLKHKFNLK